MVGAFIGFAGIAFCITLLFLVMRAVLAVGGFCAEGGPYAIRTHCPAGVPWMTPLAIFGGLISVGLARGFAWERFGGLVLLAWPALFLSLGWNFFALGFGLIAKAGIQPVGILLGIMFWLLGGGPLLLILPDLVGGRGHKGRSPASSRAQAAGGAPTHSAAPGAQQAPLSSSPSPTPSATAPAGGQADLGGELERLSGLHRGGELTGAEVEAAKRRLLGGPA